ncbi:MAG: alpha/beta fold hydrolase [Deltaproteobacteria bacterium]|nr:alpha/beta fold hydrolase [Deltaproteobacteria bacterium]
MAEERVFFESGDLKLEGLLNRGPGDAGVVITHPHPQYGGSMHNNVVESLVKAYKKADFTTLRFNFRGVGRSVGHYGEGVGEQVDVQGAAAYLEGLGLTAIHLVGYSFGAWVNAQAIGKLDTVERMIMVSPPVNFMDFSFLDDTPQLQLIITGAQDDIAPPDMIQKMLPGWNENATLRIVQGADHFYGGKTGEIESIIEAFLKQS